MNALIRVAAIFIIATALVGGLSAGRASATEADEGQDLYGFSTVIRHSDLDAFVAGETGAPSKDPVAFIGIDGASWEFINPLIDAGLLPNLARIKREGAFATLRSIPCYVSPPAWTTMFTGGLPANSGVHSFGRWDAKQRTFTNVNADDVRLPRVWDIASYCGRKVGVFNVPMTYPPRSVNGIMVGGMMTPYDVGDPIVCRSRQTSDNDHTRGPDFMESFSPVTRAVTTDSLNTYFWSLFDTIDDRMAGYDTVVLTVATDDGAVRSYTFETGEFSQWIRIRARREGEVEDAWCKFAIKKTEDNRYETLISPTFFAINDAYTSPDGFACELEDEFGYYVPSPFVGADLLARMAEESAAHAAHFYDIDDWDFYAYVFTQSDNAHHLTGFSPQAVEVYRAIDRFVGRAMESMEGNGTLVIASDHGFGRYRYGIDLNHFFEEHDLLKRREDGSIDHDRTLVFHNIWHLYFDERLITRDELARRGIYASNSDDLIELFGVYLRGLCARVAPGVGIEIVPVARAGDNDPHMRVDGACGQYLVDFLGVDETHDATIHELDGAEAWWHVRDGVLMVWGPRIQRGRDVGVQNIQDVAPTLLYAMGLPLPPSDGEPIAGVFDKQFVASRALHLVDDLSRISDVQTVQLGQRRSLEKTLRTLGYLR